ncbi:unnamed protein product [Blepharisma stoltei]|uniref:Peptidase S11 D-alanyl-D-alanine carboxypeptidase A N-terminal domain-containing protein n=1 Tax=Blepharisma stoltei TaxID=1481888 RepID=A0AAU9JTC2_9CILI|nr:unnamed protein product [Blepharisma stoltei]
MDNTYPVLRFQNSDPATPTHTSRTSALPKLGLRRSSEKNIFSKILSNPKNATIKPPSTAAATFSIDKTKSRDEAIYQRNLHKPRVTAQSWIVIDGKKGKVLSGKDIDTPREMASLTKIMTCYIAITEINSRNMSFYDFATVSKEAASMAGTSASLQAGDEITLWDLLHGLMLPSGNDAAVAIAEYIGKIIDPQSVSPIQTFIKMMNETCKILKLNATHFTNPHGMSSPNHVSTAKNIASLALNAMNIAEVREIVQAESYRCKVKNGGNRREIIWFNTNRLLKFGFSGLKTGFTPSAGPCLCCSVEKRRIKRIIVLLNSVSMESRWSEGLGLWKWSSKYF